jgi:DNA-binding transcriptional MerR regulator
MIGHPTGSEAGVRIVTASSRRTRCEAVAVGERLMRIGEVSERTGLSLRTIRHYEDVGVVAPTERSLGGFRLYKEAEDGVDAERRRLTTTLEACVPGHDHPIRGSPTASQTDEQAYEELVARLRKYWVRADARCEDLRRELWAAEEFARSPHGHPAQLLEAPTAAAKAVR